MPADTPTLKLNGTARRVLKIPEPRRVPEPVVTKALEALAKTREADRARAEKVIADHGLTIDASRLRERLARAGLSELDQLLLSTSGVVERRFLAAIKEELDDAGKGPVADKGASKKPRERKTTSTPGTGSGADSPPSEKDSDT